MFKIKPVRPELVTLAASLFLLIAFNTPLWQHLASITGGEGAGTQLAWAFGVLLLCVFNFVLTMLAFPKLLKPLLMVLFLVSACVTYFMGHYGIVVDAGMFRNLIETNVTEVEGLLSPLLWVYLLGLGVLPCVLLWKTPIAYRKPHRELLNKVLIGTGCAGIVTGVALLDYQGLSSLLRNHHELRLMVVPSNYIGASIGYAREQVSTVEHPFLPLGEDAVRAVNVANHPTKSLTVLVVGESARADNFGILGYGRDTTPQLAAEQGLVSFTDVHSCGTETAVSVPCMFSNMGRKQYKPAVAKNQEGLLDVLKRAGLDVVWWDNQSGCKGTCDRVTQLDVSHGKDPALCADSECRDEILLQGLQAFIDHLSNDTVLVLHQMGSHGPEYFKRYPQAFEHFTPVCKSNALDACSRESIVNAYDNTVLYTDHVLARLIDTLRNNQDRVATAMIYLSDHGESLGEYNVFLHGTPYMLAPDQQKHVPLLVWFSDSYQRALTVDTHCLQRTRNDPLSQDNLFHSMLGLLNVQTRVYNSALDMFAGCRGVSGNALVATKQIPVQR